MRHGRSASLGLGSMEAAAFGEGEELERVSGIDYRVRVGSSLGGFLRVSPWETSHGRAILSSRSLHCNGSWYKYNAHGIFGTTWLLSSPMLPSSKRE